MLGEGHFALLLDELLGLQPRVKVELDFFEAPEHAGLVVDGFLPELGLHVFLLVLFALHDSQVAVLGEFVVTGLLFDLGLRFLFGGDLHHCSLLLAHCEI